MGLMKIIGQEVRCGQEKSSLESRVFPATSLLTPDSRLQTLDCYRRAGMVRAEPGGVAFGQRVDQLIVEVVELSGDA